MNVTKNKYLVIVDPSLKDERGHHYSLSTLISKGAYKKGIKVIWLANREHTLGGLAGVKIIPIFSFSMYDAVLQSSKKTLIDVHFISRIPECLHPALIKLRDFIKIFIPKRYTTYLLGINAVEEKFQLFARELFLAIKANNINKNDNLLVHSADGTIYRGILDLALEKDRWENFPFVHLCTSYDETIMPQYMNGLSVTRIVDYYKLLGILDKRIFLYAENKLLTHHLKKLWNVNISNLEIPVSNKNRVLSHESKNHLNVVYLGAAREEKGFHLLPEVIHKIQSHQENKKNIHFIIQCNPQIIGYTPVIKKTIAQLKKVPNDFVCLIEQPQLMNDYYAMLDNADVVILCYQQNKYQFRGSGIAVEAVSNGKIMIVSSNTFPAEIAGDSGVQANNANEIAEKLIIISQEPDKYRLAAHKRMQEYNQSHSVENYIDTLLSTKHTFKTTERYKYVDNIPSTGLKPRKLVTSSCIKNK